MPARMQQQDADSLIQDYLKGGIVSEILQRHGRGESVLYGELRRRGIPLRRPTQSAAKLQRAEDRAEARKQRFDLSGERFGALVVIRSMGTVQAKHGHWYGQWLCQCDCGAEKVLTRQYLTKKSKVQKSCGASHHRSYWKGGRSITSHGYVYVLCPDHPRANSGGRVFEHRLVMEAHIGRHLTSKETVHHKNGVRHDNRLENLELWDNAHGKGQRVNDKVAEAVKYLQEHAPHLLASQN